MTSGLFGGLQTPYTVKTSNFYPMTSNWDYKNDPMFKNLFSGLQHQYKQTTQDVVNNLNRRGLFGSSIANEDIGKVNYGLGQAMSNLANQYFNNNKNLIGSQQLSQQKPSGGLQYKPVAFSW